MSDSNAVGAVVMRCQWKELTEGHVHLIGKVATGHRDVLVCLGYTGGMPTEVDSLTFDMRAAMIRERFPHLNLNIQAIRDNSIGHEDWSRDLDALVGEHVPAHREVVFYTGRDGFNKQYTGSYRCVEIESTEAPTATDLRAETMFPHSRDGRAALIAFHQRRPGFMYTCVDLAVIDVVSSTLVMIGKSGWGDLVGFAGGYVEKADTSIEMAAQREGREEIPGIEMTNPVQLYTMPLLDPRYRRSKKDGTVTTLCACRYISGSPKAGDDADRIAIVERKDLMARLVPWHKPLGIHLLDHWTEVIKRIS